MHSELVLSLSCIVGRSVRFLLCIFDASFIVPVCLYKLLFVNLVFSVLGSSLLSCAVFHVLSSIDENKDESYREQQEHQSRISNKALLWSVI